MKPKLSVKIGSGFVSQAQVKKYIDAQTKHAKKTWEVRKEKREKQTRLTDSPIPPAPKVAGILG